MLSWVAANPFFSLFIPPVLFVIQFLLIVNLVTLGFPNHGPELRLRVSLMLCAIFGISGFSILGILIGGRQVFTLRSKAAPLLGIALNAAYLIGFSLYFLFVIVLTNLN